MTVADLLATPAAQAIAPALTDVEQPDLATECRTIDVPAQLFSAIAPRTGELGRLVHLRRGEDEPSGARSRSDRTRACCCAASTAPPRPAGGTPCATTRPTRACTRWSWATASPPPPAASTRPTWSPWRASPPTSTAARWRARRCAWSRCGPGRSAPCRTPGRTSAPSSRTWPHPAARTPPRWGCGCRRTAPPARPATGSPRATRRWPTSSTRASRATPGTGDRSPRCPPSRSRRAWSTARTRTPGWCTWRSTASSTSATPPRGPWAAPSRSRTRSSRPR